MDFKAHMTSHQYLVKIMHLFILSIKIKKENELGIIVYRKTSMI